MRYLKKFLYSLVVLFVLLIGTLYATDHDYLVKAVQTIYLNGHKTAFLDDYKYFDNLTVKKGNHPQPWAVHKDYNKIPQTKILESTHKELGTVAFLIIKNDSIWSENYYEGYDENSKSNSFSMAKSYVTTLLGKAIMDGKIKNLDQKVADFFPEFNQGLGAKLTVGDLSSMASGLEWDESYYSPFSITTRAYFYDDLDEMMLRLKVTGEPGKSYKYLSGNTQLLGMVIEKATGKKMADYLSENFWQPTGSVNDALWQTDRPGGTEKAYCCIASNARDFARFGKLYKDHGKWNGQQLIDSALVAKFTTARFKENPEYGYGWWLHQQDGKSFFMMRGHLGQYVIVEPEDNVIIVRLGHRKSPDEGIGAFTKDISVYIEEAYKMLGQANNQ
jgi:CubicO group peptidase (beta-lactamase class C family)